MNSNDLDDKIHYKQLRKRYKQFIDLNKKLNENYKSLMKQVEGPTNYFTLPIGNMDESYIRKRKEKLNVFLRVCDNKGFVIAIEMNLFF